MTQLLKNPNWLITTLFSVRSINQEEQENRELRNETMVELERELKDEEERERVSAINGD